MLNIVQESVVQPTPTPMALRLTGEYEVQVTAHLTLLQLQYFGQDMVRCLRSLDLNNDNDDETDSWPIGSTLCFWLMSKRYCIVPIMA